MNERTPQSPPPLPPSTGSRVAAHTRKVRAFDAEDAILRTKRVRPFRFKGLEQISAERFQLNRALLRSMPEAMLSREFVAQIREIFQRYTGMDLDLWLNSVQVLSRAQVRALIPGVTLINVIGLAPLSEKLLIEVDLRLVYKVVDRLLGGNGLALDIHRPLTEIEQGVFSYLVLKTMALFYAQDLVTPEQLSIRLEDMRPDLKSVSDIMRHDEMWLCASWKMNFDLDIGYIRILVPAGMARRALHQVKPKNAGIVGRYHTYIRQRMVRIAGVKVAGIIEVGRFDLNQAEFMALEPGDIVVAETGTVRMKLGDPVGTAKMTFGRGRNGIIHGKVRVLGRPGIKREEKKLALEVKVIEKVVVPDEYDPVVEHAEPTDRDESDDGAGGLSEQYDEDFGIDDENEGEDDDKAPPPHSAGQPPAGPPPDNLMEAESLLGDLPIPVVIELGRVQLTADEVIRIRPGQLIELGRSPADPVDLVVNGRLLAKGELVEIDGALGIKILNMVHA